MRMQCGKSKCKLQQVGVVIGIGRAGLVGCTSSKKCDTCHPYEGGPISVNNRRCIFTEFAFFLTLLGKEIKKLNKKWKIDPTTP